MPLGPKAAATVAKLRESIATRARALPLARHAWARYRRRRYEHRIERFLRDKDGRADRLPIGAVYEATMRCNLHCEFCYVDRLPQYRGRVASGNDARPVAPGVPRSARISGQPDRRRDLHAQGHHVRAGSLPREGLLLRLPDDQRHDHQRRAGRGAGRPRGRGLSQAHQRLGRRTGRAARSRARAEGHVRTHLRRPAAAAGGRAAQARAAARQHQHDRRAGEPRSARRRWSTSLASWGSTPSGSTT